MAILFVTISTFALVSGILFLIVSAISLGGLLGKIFPLLTETKDHIQDLGDLSANTVGRAADTMDLVELRVSQAMGQATQAGVSVTKQALGVGTALAGLYMASRVVSVMRTQGKGKATRRGKRR